MSVAVMLLAVGVTAGLAFVVVHAFFMKLIWHFLVEKHPAAAWLNGLFTPSLALALVITISLWRDHNQVPRDSQSLLFLGYLIIVVPYAIFLVLKFNKIK